MQHIDAEVLQIAQMFLQAAQITGEFLAVERIAHPFLAEKPVVVLFARQIELAQLLRALDISAGEAGDQPLHLLPEVGAMAVKLVK